MADKKAAALLIALGKPKAKDQDSDDAAPGLDGLATDLISAVKAGDSKAVAEAFKACFLACEAQPHAEAGDE